jgi:hypothetical protein
MDGEKFWFFWGVAGNSDPIASLPLSYGLMGDVRDYSSSTNRLNWFIRSSFFFSDGGLDPSSVSYCSLE